MYYSPKDCSNGQVLLPLLSERKVNERILRSQTMQMVVHMNLWRPLMCCKLTVVNPKIRRCLKHRAVGTDGNQRTLPGYITSDLPTTRALRRPPGPTRTLKWRVLLGKSGAFCKNVMLHIRVNSRGILDGSKMLPICESRGRPK